MYLILKEMNKEELGSFRLEVERFCANSQLVATRLQTLLPAQAP